MRVRLVENEAERGSRRGCPCRCRCRRRGMQALYQREAAGEYHADDERLEVSVFDELVHEAATRPPHPTHQAGADNRSHQTSPTHPPPPTRLALTASQQWQWRTQNMGQHSSGYLMNTTFTFNDNANMADYRAEQPTRESSTG